MPMTFIRTTPFPCCKHCGEQLDHYIPFMDDKDHAHPECAGKAAAIDICNKFKEKLQMMKEKNNDQN